MHECLFGHHANCHGVQCGSGMSLLTVHLCADMWCACVCACGCARVYATMRVLSKLILEVAFY